MIRSIEILTRDENESYDNYLIEIKYGNNA